MARETYTFLGMCTDIPLCKTKRNLPKDVRQKCRQAQYFMYKKFLDVEAQIKDA